MGKTEEWKPVKGYDEYYEVSSFGNVRALDRVVNAPHGKRTIKAHALHPFDNGHGYLVVGFCFGRKNKNFYVHRLVAEAFLEKPEGKEYVNHLDYNTRNNDVNNLEWVTQKENVQYSKHRMAKTHDKVYSNTGIKRITKCKNGRYRYLFPQRNIDKKFRTLEEAIRFKETINE